MTAQPTLRERLAKVPTPMGGLALGIASLGWAWENLMPAHGLFQLAGAGVAAILLSFSEGDCTGSLGWPYRVHRTADTTCSVVVCTSRREGMGLLRSPVIFRRRLHGSVAKIGGSQR